jgi:hypothetical protein
MDARLGLALFASVSVVAFTAIAAGACHGASDPAGPRADKQPGVTAPQGSAAPGSPSATARQHQRNDAAQ